jgi:hypothetical protein
MFPSTNIYEQALLLVKLNKCTQWNQLTVENLTSILRPTVTSVTPDLKTLGIHSVGSAVTLGSCYVLTAYIRPELFCLHKLLIFVVQIL